MKLSKNKDSTDKERMSVFDATVTSEGSPMTSSEAFSQEDDLFKWIQHGIAFELECLERLSSAIADKANRHEHEGEALIDIDAIYRKALAFDRKVRKTASNHSNKENTVNGSREESKKKTIKNTSRNDNNKENTNNANGQPEKLLIRMPFVDWKTTLSKAKAVHEDANYHDDRSRGETLDTEGIGRVVSEIVEGWLIVLARLDQSSPSPSSASLPLSFVVFSSATSYRSQIYRRLTLLLLGFLGVIGLSRAPRGDHLLTDKEKKCYTMASEKASKIVEHTRDLARKILKEEGSTMKKKNNKYFVDRTNIINNYYFDPSSLPASESRRSIETDGIYYYCWFTAIAAECGEYLGDLDTALLAYKSIRAMEDRLRQNDADAGSAGSRCGVGVYACRDQNGEGTKNEIGIGIDGRALEESIARTISTGSVNSDPASNCSSPQITVTKTPANTPNAVGRKKHASNNDDVDSSWMAMATKNHHASANANANHPIVIRRSRNALFSPVPSIGGERVAPAVLLLSPDSCLVRGSNVLRNTKRSSSDSKIGNDLVPSGTLEERIRRCSSCHCLG